VRDYRSVGRDSHRIALQRRREGRLRQKNRAPKLFVKTEESCSSIKNRRSQGGPKRRRGKTPQEKTGSESQQANLAKRGKVPEEGLATQVGATSKGFLLSRTKTNNPIGKERKKGAQKLHIEN